jgi:hypothetical protein
MENTKQIYRGDRALAGKKISESHRKSERVKAAGERNRQRAKDRFDAYMSKHPHINLKYDYTSTREYHTFVCDYHGEFDTKPMYAIQSTFVCSQCATNNKRQLTDEQLRAKNLKASKTKLEKYGTLSPSRDKITQARILNSIKHLNDEEKSFWSDIPKITELYNEGNINTVAAKFRVKRDVVLGHLKRNNIPIHYNYKVSDGEKQLYSFVLELCNDAIQSDRTTLGDRRELDITVPSKNIAIEYNGLYWHCEEIRGKLYHKEKLDSCADKGFRLIQVWEDDWIHRTEVVKKFIKNALGMNHNKYNARDCDVVLVDTKDADVFYDNNHMQGGKGFYSVSIGLYIKDTLISCMSFQRRNDSLYELVRFANIGCRGAFTRLLSNFVKRFKMVDSIISFADLEIVDHNNNVYCKNGFVVDAILKPDYKYISNGVRKHKFGFRKSYFKSIGLNIEQKTESDLADEVGLLRVYDSGKVRYKYNVVK